MLKLLDGWSEGFRREQPIDFPRWLEGVDFIAWPIAYSTFMDLIYTPARERQLVALGIDTFPERVTFVLWPITLLLGTIQWAAIGAILGSVVYAVARRGPARPPPDSSP